MIKFYSGPMGSGKTEYAIALALQGKILLNRDVKVFKVIGGNTTENSPEVRSFVRSRSGAQILSDHNVYINIDFGWEMFFASNNIFDECQFLTKAQIEQIVNNSTSKKNDFHLFGLLHDFQGNLFEASAEILKHASEVKMFYCGCTLCNQNKAVLPLRKNGDEYVFSGDLVLKNKDSYISVCQDCYNEQASKKGYNRFEVNNNG